MLPFLTKHNGTNHVAAWLCSSKAWGITLGCYCIKINFTFDYMETFFFTCFYILFSVYKSWTGVQKELPKVYLVKIQLYARICGFSREHQVRFDAFVGNVDMAR